MNKHQIVSLMLSLAISLLSCHTHSEEEKLNSLAPSAVSDKNVPVAANPSPTIPDHIIFVWFENKGFPQIVANLYAPFINSLIKKGTLFSGDYALTHPSLPNYIAFFSGSTQGVSNDRCIEGTPFNKPNLYSVLKAAGKSFAWYSEGLPAVGSRLCKYGNYVSKHNPALIFSNVSKSTNKPFSSFPTDYSQLEQLVCITPDINNDMHNGSIYLGDYWLKKNLSSLIDWCATHNSIFVVFWDEDNKHYGNRIPVIAVGQHVKADYKDSDTYDHYNWTKTVCAMLRASTEWTSNLASRSVIKGCWQ
jgi:phosphatidylinositol-3-phosphatase